MKANGDGEQCSIDWVFEYKRNPVRNKLFYDVPLYWAKNRIFRFTLIYRLFICFLQFIFNKWDFSTDAFKGIPLGRENATALDRTVQNSLKGFYRWDAIHFVHIAEHGYVTENSLAFFPFFPILLRCISTPFTLIMSVQSACLLVGVVLNLISFYITARLLYFIAIKLTCSDKQATIAVILFAVNPASVFFSALYTESIFSLLTFLGISLLLGNSYFLFRFSLAATCFALGFLTRSNGVINIGYLWFYTVLDFLFYDLSKEKEDDNIVRKAVIFKKGYITTIVYLVMCTVLLTIALIYMWFPLHIYGEYQRVRFCSETSLALVPIEIKKLAIRSNVAMMGELDVITWCKEPFGLLPPFYKTIQEKYWDVGFMKYWMFSKIHCFLMATPTLFIIGFGCYQTFCILRKEGLLRTLIESNGGLIPYTIHSIIIGLSAVFMFNTEVVTRMLFSCSPFPYLILAKWMDEKTPQARLSDIVHPDFLPFLSYFSWKGVTEFLFYLFFLSYSILGTTLHSMFLPFT